MQPLAARPGVGLILPIIDANWPSRREKSCYSGLHRVWVYFSRGNPGPGALLTGRNPPARPQEHVFLDFSDIIGEQDGCFNCPDLGYMKILDAIFWRLGKMFDEEGLELTPDEFLLEHEVGA